MAPRLTLHTTAPLTGSVATDPGVGPAIAHAMAGATLSQQLTEVTGPTVRLIANLSASADVRDVAAAGRAEGGLLRHSLVAAGLVSFDVPRAAAAIFAAAMSRAPGVRSIEVAVPRKLSYVPNDVDYPHETTYLAAVNTQAAWDQTHGSASVKVAVVDSGVDTAHPDLAGKVVGVYNAMAGASTTDVTDNVGHGTFVAGVVAAATDNTTGVAGVGFNTSVLAVKVGTPAGPTPTTSPPAWSGPRAKVPGSST